MPAAAPSSPSLAPARDTSAPPRLASQRPLILVIGLALVLGSAVGVYTTLARRPAPLLDEKPTTSATTSGRPTMTAPTAFTLTLESTPAGATVMEGETILGETPLRLTIERVSVATGPRTFNLRKPGYVASQITQGASDESVRSLVSLTPEPVVAKPRPPVLPPRPTASTPPPKTSAQGNEIRPTR
jgi:serine/threonine-protein kinase